MNLSVNERIIETASRLFYFEGYNQTGINQIIREASVAKASLYQHFRSKEEIAVAYLQRRHIMWMGKLSEFVVAEESGKQKVIGCFNYLADWLTEVGFRGCGFQNIITDLPKDHQSIKDEVLSHKNELREWIHNHLKEDEKLTKKEVEKLGDEVLVLIEGAIMLSQIQQSVAPIEVARGACTRLLS
ncbi:TetR/AcrR family transcriptional regulator [Labilibaculum sp. DW002]|uniref:TetR/AcrR family transcriptional regulator n=1 Tax=Paralabilibaculum antarcticum TaxID=2912572 RepID=A0ABT5VUT1_9BACT|nr:MULTISPECIES: TetR/AcrR family transcriptional regulator [unclassified Labilibaculum]MBI9058419.1 TetR/AcrR family transcriptional regulator [Labilibaculum sp.]MDE5419171.1 TetR/AcrR family transcriptional regulator [Labilibaculum sp. DW002]